MEQQNSEPQAKRIKNFYIEVPPGGEQALISHLRDITGLHFVCMDSVPGTLYEVLSIMTEDDLFKTFNPRIY